MILFPGQDTGNVDIVLHGEFGTYYKEPKEGTQEVLDPIMIIL